LAGIAVSLSVLAWLVQQRGGNSGRVDTIWTLSVGLIGAGSTPWPIAGATPNPWPPGITNYRARGSLIRNEAPP
jgi:hypothetical protein